MGRLKGFERTYLRGLAHRLKPSVMIGKAGLTEEVAASISEALAAKELIKVKFLDLKEEKKTVSKSIEEITNSEMVGMIGNISIFFREQPDKEKRRIRLPQKGKAVGQAG